MLTRATRAPATASGGGTEVYGDAPTVVGSVATTSTVFANGTERVYLNGQRLDSPACYTTSESMVGQGYDTITFTFTLHSGDDVRVDYTQP